MELPVIHSTFCQMNFLRHYKQVSENMSESEFIQEVLSDKSKYFVIRPITENICLTNSLSNTVPG